MDVNDRGDGLEGSDEGGAAAVSGLIETQKGLFLAGIEARDRPGFLRSTRALMDGLVRALSHQRCIIYPRQTGEFALGLR